MNAVLLEQTGMHLTRQVRRWDRRLRTATSLIWGPRGIMAGVAVGVVMALLSRLRPWLLPEEIAWVTAGAIVISLSGVLGFVWLWPRSVTENARYFDHRFGLKERTSTALELIGGSISVSPHLSERQLSDAVDAARRVRSAQHLPLRVRWWEIILLVTLCGVLALLLLTDNPQTEKLRAQRQLQSSIAAQTEALQNAIQDIQNNPDLSQAEQAALTEPLANALDILQQQDATQQESVAALAEAQAALSELTDGMMNDQQAAYQDAANQLDQSSTAGDLADALRRADLAQSADALDTMANQVGNPDMTDQERQQLADQLDQAAAALENVNPALSQKLREAAQALRDGDTGAAQAALHQAADLLREQQQQLDQSPLAQQAQSAQQQVQQSQQQIAQAGTDQQDQAAGGQASSQQSPGSQQNAQGQQGPAQSLTSQEAGQPESGSNQPGAQSQPGDGQAQSPGEGASDSQQPDSGQQPGSGAAQDGTGEQSSGGGQTAGSQSGDAQGQLDSSGDGSTAGASSLTAGQGEGGAGVNDVAGTYSELSPGQNASDSTSEGGLQDYTPQNPSSTIGGESSQTVDVGGSSSSADGTPVQQGDFGPNPQGEARLSYTRVFGNYQNIVSDALESGRIPLDQRDVIHDYFSSLDR